jgi:hypothetical protein
MCAESSANAWICDGRTVNPTGNSAAKRGDRPCGEEILHHGAVAVQEDDGPALAMLDVVKTCAAGRDEPSLGRIGQLRLSRVAV